MARLFALRCFILAPSILFRLDNHRRRLALARRQQEQKDRFDYVIVNDDVNRAADELTAIVQRQLQAAGTMSRP